MLLLLRRPNLEYESTRYHYSMSSRARLDTQRAPLPDGCGTSKLVVSGFGPEDEANISVQMP